MKLRIGYDGHKYWVEQLRWFGIWEKCPRNWSDWDRPLRFQNENDIIFNSQEDAYDYAKQWREHFSLSHLRKTVVYAKVK